MIQQNNYIINYEIANNTKYVPTVGCITNTLPQEYQSITYQNVYNIVINTCYAEKINTKLIMI